MSLKTKKTTKKYGNRLKNVPFFDIISHRKKWPHRWWSHISPKSDCIKSVFKKGYSKTSSNFCVIHFLSYSPIFKENYTHVLCHTHCVIHFFTAIFSVTLHVGTKEPIKSSYKALTLLSELLISGYVGKEKPKIRRAFRRKPKRTH